ncbi:hypothetical protein IID24_00020 [Patescibacteria group bacterium]|nr:hypothetical protein [Patescibacteria group bacterium]
MSFISNGKTNFTYILIIIILALVVSGGTYLWQQSIPENELQRQNDALQRQIDNLQNQLNEISTEKDKLQKQLDERTVEKDELQKQLSELTAEPNRYVRVISPNGGEKLCLGEDFIIRWESEGLQSVRVAIRIPAATTSYIGTFPATFNESGEFGTGTLPWKVGEYLGGTIRESFTYKILVEGDDRQINDVSDDLFSIIRCEG